MPPTTSPIRHSRGSSVQKRATKPVAEQYVEELLKEIERLRSSASDSARTAPPAEEVLDSSTAAHEAVRNPLLEEGPWFHAVSSEHVPIHVGEAADAAFATRFRQTLAVGNTKHLPRMSHVKDDSLMLLSGAPFSWPSPARARFLVKVALSTICQYYHIVRKSQVTRVLEEAIKNNGNGDRLVISFPGLAYFAQARKMISIPAERPQMDTIEVALLLVLFSFTVNRRHSAYIFASSACRLGLIMGMNMNIPEQQCSDRLLAARLTRAIYSRRNHHDSFSKRVQAMLKDLTKWMDALPAKFQIKENDASVPVHIVYIHLRFNQCCILATRPILLHVLRSHKQSWSDPTIDPKRNLPEGALALAETCIQCARHTYRILTDAWIHGTLATLDYFDTQYLFSATTILAISSLLRSPRSQSDGDNFQNAVELLRQLAQSGNYGAKEFVEHTDAMEQSMQLVSNTSFALVPPRQQPLADPESMLPPPSEAMTAGMALADPSLQYFLSESDLDLQALSNPSFGGLQTPYWWADGWGVGADV
ncbi:c6 transcription factor [Stemphylium lycopersici]|nr:c6 transcription factor [Stemphylium lycopersici]